VVVLVESCVGLMPVVVVGLREVVLRSGVPSGPPEQIGEGSKKPQTNAKALGNYLKHEKQIVRDQMSCLVTLRIFSLLISEQNRCRSVLTGVIKFRSSLVPYVVYQTAKTSPDGPSVRQLRVHHVSELHTNTLVTTDTHTIPSHSSRGFICPSYATVLTPHTPRSDHF
jgi:hypothetical protein